VRGGKGTNPESHHKKEAILVGRRTFKKWWGGFSRFRKKACTQKTKNAEENSNGRWINNLFYCKEPKKEKRRGRLFREEAFEGKKDREFREVVLC